MGSVKMAQEITGEWEDLNGIYPYATATLYIYCDQCGSFSIKTCIGRRKAALIMLSGILLTVGILAMLHLSGGIYWLGACLTVCILALRYLWGGPDYVCRKCGSVPSTRFNTRGYPSDIGLLDIPDRLTQKQYVGYFPDSKDLDNALLLGPGQLTDMGGAASRILGDLEGLKTLLLYILGIPLLMILTVIYPTVIIVYVVWTEVVPKLSAAMPFRKKAR